MTFEFDVVSMAPGKPGWLELRMSGGGEDRPRLIVKFVESSGRYVLTRVIVAGSLDSQTLRAIPLGRIEAALNHPKFGPLNVGGGSIPPEILEDLARREILFPEEFDQLDDALDRYLERSAEQIRDSVKIKKANTPRRAPLSRPDGSDPDGFSRRVADAYNDAVVSTSAPAPVLAEEADVPVATVHRWIAEARRRGHLPPARKGRAG